MRVYIGYDPVEDKAYEVAKHTLLARDDCHQCIPLKADELRARGLYWRDVDKRGQPYDLPSQAPCSTEFSSSRFLTPILEQEGWVLFTDCDVLFLDDPAEILSEITPGKAVYVVKHVHHGAGTKMGGLIQTAYDRKNWSSVMLFDCSHPANRRLTLNDVNVRPGRDLHRFYWLHDTEIGQLHPRWNWLVNVQDKPEVPGIAHFTNGGPWLDNWDPSPYDELWLEHANSR